jgi:phosphatidylserine decarboxylase
VLNVHVNRAPCDATIVKSIHRPGKYFDARTDECARLNESNLIFMTRHWPGGIVELFGVRQVSGKIARRIVDDTKPGNEFKRGEHIGMIKFGSTTELILPRPGEVEVLVKVGQNVRAPRTPLARLRPPQSVVSE